MQCENASVAFSLEASKVSRRWHVLRIMTNKWVVVVNGVELCNVSVTNGNYMSVYCGISDIPRCV
jgi:hypothetical protein